MQILHLITNFEGPGGAERMLARLVNHTPEHHHLIVPLIDARAEVLELLTGSNFDVLPLRCQRTPSSVGLRALPRLRDILKDRAVDVIQGWMYHGNLVGCLHNLASRRRVPLWLGIHHSLDALPKESHATQFAIYALRPLLPAATGIVFCAERAREQHLAFGWRHPRCEVIPNGFDFPPPSILDPTSIHGHSPDRASAGEFVLGAAGRLHPAKDYPTLFRAVAGLMHEHERLRLRLAGRGLTPDNTELRALLSTHGLPAERVELLGQIRPAQMPDFYRGLDAFVLPSRNEGLPSTLIEAMAAELPCVTTDVGDAGRVLGLPARVVPPGAPEELDRALEGLLTLPESVRRAEGIRNRRRALGRYSMTRARDRYVGLWSRPQALREFAETA